jgi:peptidoglycan hydrolase-like protein with peptidoglycan-binding domain
MKNAKGLDLKVRTAQMHMMYLGLYSGKIDGLKGPATRRALARLQNRCGLPVDGNLDGRTQAALDEQYAALVGAH